MEVSAEAKRVMVVALGKLYSSRTQRGGLRLHRSLLLTLVMKSARDIYHEAQATAGADASGCEQQQQQQQQHSATVSDATVQTRSHCARAPDQPRTLQSEEVAGPRTKLLPRYALTSDGAEDKENLRPAAPAQHSRKRRSDAAAEPDFLPCKKAKLEQAACARQQVAVSAVLMDYVTCSSEVGASPAAGPLRTPVAVC